MNGISSFLASRAAELYALYKQNCEPEPKKGDIAPAGVTKRVSIGDMENLSRQDITYVDRYKPKLDENKKPILDKNGNLEMEKGQDGIEDGIIMNVKGHDEKCDEILKGARPLRGTIDIDKVKQTVTVTDQNNIGNAVKFLHTREDKGAWKPASGKIREVKKESEFNDKKENETALNEAALGVLYFKSDPSAKIQQGETLLIELGEQNQRSRVAIHDLFGNDDSFYVEVFNDTSDLKNSEMKLDKTTIGVGADTSDLRKKLQPGEENKDLKVIREAGYYADDGYSFKGTARWTYLAK